MTAPRRMLHGRERVALSVSYVDALARVGLLPLAVPTTLAPDRAAAALDLVTGLVLTGGEDVAPERYGAAPRPTLGTVDPARDAAELGLIAAARARGLPILGICRGLQILNVAFGGTLYQDLDTERPGDIAHAGVGDGHRGHVVRVAPGSLMAAALGDGDGRCEVNTKHHQAIKDLAPALRATAWAEDGLIEAVEAADPA
ncbi:MAG: gamma-glutamyl-gamma-aminobutyrate hydrolase family protein, partial [Gemmatimonadales bacterium]